MISGLKVNEDLKRSWYEQGWWSERTLFDEWSSAVSEAASKEYVADYQGVRYSYGQVDEQADRLATWLSDAGVGNGDVVSLQFPTWADFCVAYVACLKLGAVIHPLPLAFNEPDMRYSMAKVGTKALICPTRFRHSEYETAAVHLRDELPSLQVLLCLDRIAPSACGLPSMAQVIADTEPRHFESPARSEDVAVILSTSGTTGPSKAAMLTHNNILFAERVYSKAYERGPEDVLWNPCPFNHATGFFHGLITPMLMRSRVVLEEHFSPAEAVELINGEGVTWSIGSTPFIYDLMRHLEAEDKSVPTLDVWACGGAPLPGRMIKQAHGHGIRLCESYGSTESSPHIYVPPSKAVEWNGEWSGIPCDGVEVRVVDAQGTDVAPGERGEELSRGPNVFAGYLNDPERTAEALDDEGWFHSGDLCYQDEQGRIKICGRLKELIVRGGEKVGAREVDQHVEEHPDVYECATVGMPDDRMGERICTFIVPEEGRPVPTVPQMQGFLAAQGVAKRLWPERIEAIEALPKTPMGKIQRYKLEEEIRRRLRS